MRSTLLRVGIGAIAGALAVWWVLGGRPAGSPPEAASPEAGEEAGAPVRVERGPGGVVVRLGAATRERIGLETAAVAALDAPEEVAGFGRALDPAALAAPVYEREAARAAADAAGRELQRVGHLARGSADASARELEAARAADAQARATLLAADARVASVWGAAAAQRGDLPALVRALVAREACLARIDLPSGTPLPGAPTGGRVADLAGDGGGVRDATLLGVAPDADPATQGTGYLLLVRSAPWPAGAALAGWLAFGGAPRAGVDLPASAVVRHEGQTFVYVQRAEDAYARTPVRLARPTGDGWLVREGLAAGDRVVVAGAQQLLAAEVVGAGMEED